MNIAIRLSSLKRADGFSRGMGRGEGGGGERIGGKKKKKKRENRRN